MLIDSVRDFKISLIDLIVKEDARNNPAFLAVSLNNKTITIIENNMLISNLEVLPNQKITQHLGLVQGSSVRAKHVGRDIMASLKNIFGGELKGYTELLQESREEAMERLQQQAEAIGANAILNVRFSTSSVAQGAAEIYVYGTAVIIEEN